MVIVTMPDDRLTSMVSTEMARYWGDGLQHLSQVRRQAGPTTHSSWSLERSLEDLEVYPGDGGDVEADRAVPVVGGQPFDRKQP